MAVFSLSTVGNYEQGQGEESEEGVMGGRHARCATCCDICELSHFQIVVITDDSESLKGHK